MLLRTLALLCLCLACFAEAPKKTIVKVDSFFQPNNMENIYTKQLVWFMQKHPEIRTIYIITDSEQAYREMIRPYEEKACYQLYRDYLDNFRINTGR